jgi:KTSC domain
MQRTPVKSGQILSIGHDPSTSTLEIEFPRGALYRYSGVSAEDASKFMGAESIGKHFAAHIKGKFDYSKVETKPEKES